MQQSNGFQHKEAFCLMNYRCQRCNQVELLWNSRDGVTPFIVRCAQPECKGEMQHIDFWRDRPVGELSNEANRVFINLTREAAKAIAEQIVKHHEEQTGEPAHRDMLRELTESYYGGGIQPHVVSRFEYLVSKGHIDPNDMSNVL